MHAGVACRTERNQVLGLVFARVAAESFMVNLKIRHRAASLASPAIPAEYLVAELFV